MIVSRMKAPHSHNKADYVGIFGSVLCIIHCLLMPAVTLGSSFGHLHRHEAGLLSLDLVFIIINGFAVYFATRAHKLPALRLLLWGALLLFSVSIIFENQSSVFTWLGYIGSGLLIIGHLINLYICQIAPRFRFKF